MDNAEPTRYRVAPIEHQMTYGGGVLQSAPDGPLVAYGDYARLKAEVERLTFDPLTYLDDQGEWMPRHTHLAAVERLKAEVERLEHQVNYWRIEAETDNARWLRCLEDKDRLTKAGDAMEVLIVEELAFYEDDGSHYDEVKAWSDAKGGKQS